MDTEHFGDQETTVLAFFWHLPAESAEEMLQDIARCLLEGHLRLCGNLRAEPPESIAASAAEAA